MSRSEYKANWKT